MPPGTAAGPPRPLLRRWRRRIPPVPPAPGPEVGPATDREDESRDAILSSLDEGVVLLDEDGEVLYRNRLAEELLAAGEDLRAAIPSALGDAIDRAVAGHRASVELAIGRGPRLVRATTSGLPDRGHVLVVLRDVTEARRLEAVRRDFVANASHELKTPAASVQALAETILSASSDDPTAVPRFAEQLHREAVRLSRVVSDLLDLSRLEGGSQGHHEVRLDQLLADEVARVRDRAQSAGLTLTLHDGAPVEVTGSEQDLGLLVRNLLDNAIQYTPAGGRVDATLSTDGAEATLGISDTGIGIPSKDRGRVFERFYRVDRARSRDTGGTGLGLSIVKHVAENHGGSVSVESELGTGSTFVVRLPLAGPG